MREALDASGRDIVYSLCQYGMGERLGLGRRGRRRPLAHHRRHHRHLAVDVLHRLRPLRPGLPHRPERLERPRHARRRPPRLGLVSPRANRLSGNEQITHITLWSMLAAPLLIGCDLTQVDDLTKRLLMNHDVIEIDQDPLGKPATRVHKDGDLEVWARPLADGAYGGGPVQPGVAEGDDRDGLGARPRQEGQPDGPRPLAAKGPRAAGRAATPSRSPRTGRCCCG